MDHALLGGLVDALDGEAQGLDLVVGPGGSNGGLLTGEKLGAHGAVARASLLVLTIALDLALDVGHDVNLGRRTVSVETPAGVRYDSAAGTE